MPFLGGDVLSFISFTCIWQVFESHVVVVINSFWAACRDGQRGRDRFAVSMLFLILLISFLGSSSLPNLWFWGVAGRHKLPSPPGCYSPNFLSVFTEIRTPPNLKGG